MNEAGANKRFLSYAVLIGAFLVYSFSSVFTKWASMTEFRSVAYILRLSGAVAVLGVYAILWQQIIKRMRVSDAFMFKGTTIIFILLLSHFFFGEAITLTNVVGALVIICGIALHAKS